MYFKQTLFIKIFLWAVIINFIISCNTGYFKTPTEFTELDITDILIDPSLNIRTLEITDNMIYAASSKGEIYSFLNNKPNIINVEQFSSFLDSVQYPNFRSMSVVDNNVFAMTIGSPALLFKNGKVVYREKNEKVFYDSMDFWNLKEGLVVGDYLDGCISVLITRDGGETWDKLLCDKFKEPIDNEGFFAASDTNISIVGDEVWIGSGGFNSRIYYSKNKGIAWDIINTPIIQGESTKGIYSIDFYNKNIGFAIGGDYTKPEENISNKILTTDGGKNWKVVANNQNPGYRSCVKYFPNSNGNSLIAVGFNGVNISNDGGNTWKKISDEGFYTVRFLNENTAYAAGKGKISKLHFK